MTSDSLRATRGRVHSFQSFGTLDGPGVRAVVFVQGCPLRCACCHNPDTWDVDGGEEKPAGEVFDSILRCRAYFGKNGGVTVSGGEPLMSVEFVTALFSLCREAGIHTALDTSGYRLDEDVKQLLRLTDLVLLDYKYTNREDYAAYTGGCDKRDVDSFLGYLNSVRKPTWLRQVVIEGLNDSEESLSRLFALRERYACIEKIELLPFHKLCIEKYRALGIPFPLEDTPETPRETIDRFYMLFDK